MTHRERLLPAAVFLLFVGGCTLAECATILQITKTVAEDLLRQECLRRR